MSKGQKRSNREAKKPKQLKAEKKIGVANTQDRLQQISKTSKK